jgi:hypothetical protein
MDRLTLTPWLVALVVGLAAMTPTNIYKVCAWNTGIAKLEPWRRRTSAAARDVVRSLRSWLASFWTWRTAFVCLAILLIALMVAQHPGPHDGVLLAVGPITGAMKAKRARLLREANALKRADGTFADDAARQAFDAKMADIESIDGQSQTLDERNASENAGRTNADDPPEAEEPNERDEATAAERARNQGITLACRAARLPQSFADTLVQDGVSLVDAQTRVFKELMKRGGQDRGPSAGPSGAVEITGDDPLVHVRAGIEEALLHRVRPQTAGDKKGFELTDKGRPYRGMTLLRIAEAYLNHAGIRTTSLSKMKIAGLALGLVTRSVGMHTTSDFANLLADVANKTLRRAYEEAPQTWIPISRRTTLPDFKPVKRLQIGDAPAL